MMFKTGMFLEGLEKGLESFEWDFLKTNKQTSFLNLKHVHIKGRKEMEQRTVLRELKGSQVASKIPAERLRS